MILSQPSMRADTIYLPINFTTQRVLIGLFAMHYLQEINLLKAYVMTRLSTLGGE